MGSTKLQGKNILWGGTCRGFHLRSMGSLHFVASSNFSKYWYLANITAFSNQSNGQFFSKRAELIQFSKSDGSGFFCTTMFLAVAILILWKCDFLNDTKVIEKVIDRWCKFWKMHLQATEANSVSWFVALFDSFKKSWSNLMAEHFNSEEKQCLPFIAPLCFKQAHTNGYICKFLSSTNKHHCKMCSEEISVTQTMLFFS